MREAQALERSLELLTWILVGRGGEGWMKFGGSACRADQECLPGISAAFLALRMNPEQ